MTYYNQLNYTVNNGRKWVPVTKMLQINDDHRTMQLTPSATPTPQQPASPLAIQQSSPLPVP